MFGKYGIQFIGVALLCYMGIHANLVCLSNLGLWSRPEDRPHIERAYEIGSGNCDGIPPIIFTPDCWNGILPHPCITPKAFDRIALLACKARGFSNPEACMHVGYLLRRGICENVLKKGGDDSLVLDCGNPHYWNWRKVTSPSQLRPGWKGTCILKLEPVRSRPNKGGRIRRVRHVMQMHSPLWDIGQNRGSAISLTTPVPKSHHKPRVRTSNEECGPCIQVTVQGTRVANTLIYHTRQPEGCIPSTPATCQVNNTQYLMCTLKGKVHCYNPAEAKSITVYEMAIYTTECGREELLNKTEFRALHKPVELTFDACLAINRNC